MNNVKNVKFSLTKSIDKDFEEVLVTFSLNGEMTKYFIFIKKNKAYRKKDYLKEAKKRFYADLKSNKVKKVLAIGHRKKWIVLAASICGVAAISCTGYFTYKYLANPDSEWKVSTREKIFEIRDKVLEEQYKSDIFTFLSKTFGGKQFKAHNVYSDNMEESYRNEHNYVGDSFIDFDNVYIKEDGKDEDGRYLNYRAYYGGDKKEGKGIYDCGEDESKYANYLCGANDIDDARSKFVYKLDGEDPSVIETDIEEILGYTLFGKIKDGSEINDRLVENLEIIDVCEGQIPTSEKFYINVNDNLSFKIVASAKGNVSMEGQNAGVDTSFECVVEKAALVHAKLHLKMTSEDQPVADFTEEYSIEKASFTLDDLSEYFQD